MSHAVFGRVFQPPPPSYIAERADVVSVVHAGFPIFASASFGEIVYLYFHGNGTDLGETAAFLGGLAITLRGQVFSVEYPGYGALVAKRASEKGIYDAADALLAYVTSSRGVALGNIVVWGFSLGSLGASYLAGKNPGLRAVILQSAFSNGLPAISKHLNFLGRALHCTSLPIPFSNIVHLRAASTPQWRLHLFHGGLDAIATREQQSEMIEAVPAQSAAAITTFPKSGHDFLEVDFMEMVRAVREAMEAGSR